MSATYVSGPYTSGQLLRDVRAVEDAITQHFRERGPITDAADQRSMTERLLDVSQGRNTVIFDDQGNPSVMVRVPFMRLSDLELGWPDDPHPAFVIGNRTLSEVYIAKYQAMVVGSGSAARAVSLRGVEPTAAINFDNARAACINKGPGWHLMTNAEWAAIALWCRRNGFWPRGNDYYGSHHQRQHERGDVIHRYGGRNAKVATGSGPVSWTHDGTPFGIYDLRGNVWEWVDGLKLVNGRIYVHPGNDYTVGNSEGNVDGWVDTQRYFDGTQPGDNEQTDHQVPGSVVLSNTRQYPMYTGGDTNAHYGYISQPFRDTQPRSGVTVPDLLRYLAIMPPTDTSTMKTDHLWVRNYGERVAARGGYWVHAGNAGVCALALDVHRSLAHVVRGLRAAFIP